MPEPSEGTATSSRYGFSLDIEGVFQNGFRRALSPHGLVVAVGFFVAGIVGEVGPETGRTTDIGPFVVSIGSGSFDPGLPLLAVFFLHISAYAAAVAVAVYAFRSFACETDEFDPGYERSFAEAAFVAVLSSAAFAVLVTAGLALFVVPGVYLAVSLPFFVAFAALGDDGPLEALRSSWNMTDGHRGSVFAVLSVFFLFFVVLLGFLVTIVSAVVSRFVEDASVELAAILGVVGEKLLYALVALLFVAVLYEVYLRLRDRQTP